MAEVAKGAVPVWRTAGGDNSRRGLIEGRVRMGSQPSRRLLAQGAVQAAVVFGTDGTAFVADMAGGVQAFSPDGTRLWRVGLEGAISATPVVHPKEPKLFVGTQVGWVYALDTRQGATSWKTTIATKSDPRILSDLLFHELENVVVLSSWGGRFCALDAATGKERFGWDAGISPSAAAAADDQGSIYCLRAVRDRGIEFISVSGKGEEKLLHRQPAGKRGPQRALVAAAPVLDEAKSRAYFITNLDQGGLLHAWSLASNAAAWQHPLSATVQATPALAPDGTILLADLAGFVQAIAPDGTARYRYASGCEYLLAGGVVDSEGRFIFGDPLGVIHAIDAQGVGGPIFQAGRSIQARPAADPQGGLYVPATDRMVYVFS